MGPDEVSHNKTLSYGSMLFAKSSYTIIDAL